MGRKAYAIQRNSPNRRRASAPGKRKRQPRRNPSYRQSTVYSATVTNAGIVATFPTISIAGPVTPATVYFENTTQGKTVWINQAVAAGQTLSVDFSTRTVTLAGTTVTGVVSIDSRWWDLSSGANTIRSNVAATVTHRDAYT